MTALDPEFERAARHLPVWELTQEPSRLPLSSLDDLFRETRFLDFYSPEGLRRALEHYGIEAALKAQGLDDFEVLVDREDAYDHRLQMFLGPRRNDNDRILDLRLHLRELWVDEQRYEAVGIEWMTMQNPRAAFSSSYPRLPGQRFPGTHLGRAAHNLLMIMTERIGRQALVTTPASWHLARLYMRGGYRFAQSSANDEVTEVGVSTRRLKFAAAAWAVERGLVMDAKTSEPYVYEPTPMLLPLTPPLKMRVRLAAESVREFALSMRPRLFTFDLEALSQSLREDPVEGLSPDDLTDNFWF